MPWNLLNADVEMSPEVLEDPRAAGDGCLIRAQAHSDFIQCFHLMVHLILKAVSILIGDAHYDPHHQYRAMRKATPAGYLICKAIILNDRSLSQRWVSGLDSGKITHCGRGTT